MFIYKKLNFPCWAFIVKTQRSNSMKKYIIIFALLGTVFAVDFSNDVSPIIYKNCTGCHRVGEIASFLPLMSYENIYDNRDWIAYAISGDGSRHDNPIMPPWPPDREYSSMVGERYLTENELHTILQWIEDGAPQGNPDDEYPMPEWPEGSMIGVPDVVYEMEEPTFIEGNNEDYYRCYVIEAGFSEDKDIAAVEFRPDNSEAVHHALIIAVPHGMADALDEADPGYGYECYGGFGLPVFPEFIGGYAPGFIPTAFPEGLGQELPANSDLILQMHYAPLNTDQTDQSSFNVFFKDEPVERYVQEHLIIDYTLVLPPEQISTVTNTFTVYEDVSLVSILPHCHLIGQSWEIYGATQSNEIIPILKIPQWDFDWQSFYSPQFMQRIPAGTVITATCVYDNTSNNPNNPNDPPQWMGWGEGTNDEMFFVPIRYVPYQEGDENIFLGSDEEAPVLLSQLDGWNLIGLPREVEDPIYSALFPEALTGTFL
tara:strand:+ start:12483 stop:13937 length:1455 start_codon:yes stop_codon:yes gene_type:complete